MILKTHKRVYEDFNAEDSDIIAGRILAGEEIMNQIKSEKDLPTTVAEMEEVPVVDKNGQPVLVPYTLPDGTKTKKQLVLNCANIAYKGTLFVEHIKSLSETAGLAPYLEKPIIWTFTCDTAWSNGFRIAFSPLFAWSMFKKGSKGAKTLKKELEASGDENMYKDISLLINARLGKEFEFIIIHEIYHTLYRHHYRGFLVYGAHPTNIEHYIANVSMDLEINRDICALFPQYNGAVLSFGGIWYLDEKYMNLDGPTPKPFVHETWEDIYEYFMNHKDQLENLEENASKNAMEGTSDPETLKKENQQQQEPEQKTRAWIIGWEHAGDMVLAKKFDYTKLDIDYAKLAGIL